MVLSNLDNPSLIQSQAADAINGVQNSLTHQLARLQRKCCAGASWFEEAGTPTATHFADRIGTVGGGGAFRIDAGDETWGDWVQILGSGDTPARATPTMTYFTPYRIIVADVERSAPYFVQITRGDSGAAGLDAGNYTEVMYVSTNTKDAHSIELHAGYAPAGSLVWARCLAVGYDTGWMDFYFGITEAEN